MTAPTSLVLVTGATGFIGYRTLIEALKAGHRVRAAVRNENGIQKIKAASSTRPYLSQLEFTLVPDILKEDAYYEAVKGVDSVIHLASPTTNLPTTPTEETYDEWLLQPAVRGTLNMLEAASKYSPTTKRIVITASIVSIIEWPEMFMETGSVFNEQSRTGPASKPYGGLFAAYGAGKVATLNATEQYIRTQRPHFEVNHIGPGFVIGKNELATKRADILASTNGAALGPILGSAAGPTPSTSVFVNDVARMHVLALDPKVAGGQLFLGVSENSNTKWEDAFDIVKKQFPKAVEDGTFPLTGSNPTKRLIFDNGYTKKALGVEFASYEEQVKSVAGQYLELKE
ncbi:uncharacterized protein KY384_008902 [Bacidia gigantensis]|uniref:uncharacterized protein n=1 Tax=Bacidia gigantensis TaxID=2732470 RepID=UPI001D038E51|nr:uncharacterized protein KY384_008902 [Bacidia gigantensis]KAG8525258.1 hypothetical protein KY384_008902 [Bacidia gigantensis]